MTTKPTETRWMTTGLLALALLLAVGCRGEARLAIDGDPAMGTDGESPYPAGSDETDSAHGAEAEDDDEYLHPVGQVPETELDEPDPNTLPQDELFQCDADSVGSSPSRVRRLTAAQFLERWDGSTKPPYAASGQFRYSTDDRDSRLDDGTADQLVTKALQLGASANDRRIGWGRCMRREILDGARPDRGCLEEWATGWLAEAWERDVTTAEVSDFVDFTESAIDTYGIENGLTLAAGQPYADPRFLYRLEIADSPLDEHGRKRLGSWSIAQAVAMAVTDRPLSESRTNKGVDQMLAEATNALADAAGTDALGSREEVEAHVRALLEAELPTGEDGEQILPTKIERFFQEYLGHTDAEFVFKNGGETPDGQKDYKYYKPAAFADSTDGTIAMLYAEDQEFLRQLLTTRDYWLPGTKAWPYNLSSMENDESERDVSTGVHSFPDAERAGLITHPGWLAAHSGNQHVDPHPVHRGKWVLENLLCGSVPDLPLTVDAQMPDMPSSSVRERLEAVTDPSVSDENAYCNNCHGLMNPLGIPFETYSHYGRHRSDEMTGDGSLVEVDAAVTLPNIGAPGIDGAEVSDAVEMMELFADSDRVEGCFVRQTFRYFTGRNETKADACTLVAMRDTYRDSGGSFREMLVELLTSDTFLYRSIAEEEEANQ